MVKFKSSKNPAGAKGKEKGPKLRFPFVGTPRPATCREIERYPLNAPFAYAVLAEDQTTRTRKYYVDEVLLSPREAAIYTYLLDTLESELSVPRSESFQVPEYVRSQAPCADRHEPVTVTGPVM